MDNVHTHPLEQLAERLHFLGKLLAALCCVWIAVVGSALMREITPDTLEHHRSPVMQERLKTCEGEFHQRYACADTILINGQRNGAIEVMMRMGLTLLLPTIAWSLWSVVVNRTDRLCRWLCRH